MTTLAVAAWLSAGCSRRPWNVVLVTFDTTRADFLGCYGREQSRTPTLDGLAARGFVFEHASSSNPVTQASHSTILTGTYPMAHGVHDNVLFHLAPERVTLAERLHDHGYATGAAIGGFPLVKSFGTDQGFDFYDDDLDAAGEDERGRPLAQRSTWYAERPAAYVNDAIRPWLREHLDEHEEQPFFVWLHYWDPHEPHIPPPPYSDLFRYELYDGEIAYADASLGAFLDELKRRGELDRTLVVMTADHGEGRQQHGEMTHAFLAYESTLHVPLILQVPGNTGAVRIARRVGTVDIVPTVLDLLGFPVPSDVQGSSLKTLMLSKGARDQAPPPYYAESLSPRLTHGLGELRVVYSGPFKYIHGPRPELYDLAHDSDELHDLAGEQPEEAARLGSLLASLLSRDARSDAAEAMHEVDEATRRRLAALGYLSTGGTPQAVSEELRSDGIAPQDRVSDMNLLGQLRNQLAAEQFDEARDSVLRLLAASPQQPFFRAKLAAAELGLGHVDAAVRVVEDTDEISSANQTDFLAVAQALFDRGDEDAALAMAQRLAAPVETARAVLTLARMQRAAGRPDAAATLRRALALDEKDPGVRLEMARFLRETEHAAEAKDLLVRLLQDFPIDLDANLAYAEMEAEAGGGEKAAQRLARMVKIYPGACSAHLARVRTLLGLDARDRAAAALGEMRQACRDREARREAAALLEVG